ncbi:MAG: DNA polymerase III subunit epsilon, partial [Planctomycetota bacterium]
LAERCGATCRQSVSRNTDWLVVGEPDERTQRSGRSRSVKEERAIGLAEAGHSVRIVTEADFLRLLVSPEIREDA